MGQIFKNYKKQNFLKKILIVGSGEIAFRHYKNLLKLNEKFHIDLFLRKKNSQLEKKFKKANLIYSKAQLFKENYYASIICNPAPLHLEFAFQLVKKNTNMYIEKPISSEDYKKTVNLFRLCLKKKVTLQIGYNLLYLNSLNFLKKILKTNRLGKIYIVKSEAGYYLPFWRKKNYSQTVSANKKLGGGVITELSHEISYLLWLFGSPKSLYSKTKKLSDLKIDVEDYAKIIFSYKNNMISSCSLDFLNKSYTRKLEIIGKKTNIHWDYKKNKITQKIFNKKKLFRNKIITFKKHDTYFDALKDFFYLCRVKKTNPLTVNAINTLKIIIEAKKSAIQNKSIILRNKKFSI